jgi:hypothetical protein
MHSLCLNGIPQIIGSSFATMTTQIYQVAILLHAQPTGKKIDKNTLFRQNKIVLAVGQRFFVAEEHQIRDPT